VDILLVLLFLLGFAGLVPPFRRRIIASVGQFLEDEAGRAANHERVESKSGWRPLLRSGVLVVGAPLIALLSSLPIKAFSPYPFLMFFAAVSVVTWMTTLWWGIVALLFSILLADYFLFSPLGGSRSGFSSALGLTLSGCMQLLICWLIDSRKQAEDALVQQSRSLRRSELLLVESNSAGGRLRAIFDNILDGIIMMDATGSIIFLNRSIEYEAFELIGKNTKTLLTEPNRPDLDGHLARYQSSPKTSVVGAGRVLEGLTKMGRTIPIEFTVTETSLHGERLFVGLIRDITDRISVEFERDRHERTIRQNEELMERTGMLAGVGGWEHDLLTDELNLSPVSRRIFGVGPEQRVTANEMLKFYANEDRPAVLGAMERAVTDGAPWDMERQIVRTDGTRGWVRTVGIVEYTDGRPTRILGAHQDVSALVAERDALRKAHERINLATDGGNVGIWDWEIETGRWIWDAWMFRLYGMDRGLLVCTLTTVRHPNRPCAARSREFGHTAPSSG
jgi:PAS domain S-box-containing protein